VAPYLLFAGFTLPIHVSETRWAPAFAWLAKRECYLISAWSDEGPEQWCSGRASARWLTDSRFVVAACFEAGPRAKTLHLATHGSFIPNKPVGGFRPGRAVTRDRRFATVRIENRFPRSGDRRR
jgi:hypothetical protein